MSQQAREWRDLAANASTLSDAKFLAIVALFEKVRHEPGIAGAMDLFRTRMASLRPPRRTTADRLFFRPLEDLLDNPDRYRRRLSRINRGVLSLCWSIVADWVGAEEIRRINRLLGDIDSQDSTRLIRLGQGLWENGAAALVEALERARRDLKVQARLFGRDEDVLRQVEGIAEVTAIGALVEEVKARLPDRPIPALADFHAETVRRAVQDLAAQGLHRVTPFLLVLTARMQRPGDLLALLGELDLGGTPKERDELMRDIGIAAVESMLHHATQVTDQGGRGAAAIEIAGIAERVLEGFDSLRGTLSRSDQKRLAQRVEVARAAISTALLDHVVGPSEEQMLSHVGPLTDPAAWTGPGGPPLPGPEEMDRAEAFAHAYRRTARIAPLVGLKDTVARQTTRLCRGVGEVSQALGEATRRTRRTNPAAAAAADEQMVALLRLVEIIAGPDEAEALLVEWEQDTAPSPPGLDLRGLEKRS